MKRAGDMAEPYPLGMPPTNAGDGAAPAGRPGLATAWTRTRFACRVDVSRSLPQPGEGMDALPRLGPQDRASDPHFTEIPIDRRRFMILVGGAVAYTALRPHLAWAGRVARAYPPLQPWALPEEPPGNPLDMARALIGAAVLAPSNWNSQPWRFEVDGASIRLIADAQRSLPVTDPDQRGMMLSLGASLENLLVAARAYG